MSYKQTLCVLSFFILICITKETKAGFALDSIPKGWRAALSTAPDVVMGVDTIIKHTGKASGFIKREGGSSNVNGTGIMLQSILADEYRGKRVRMSVYAKSDAIMRGILYFRVDGQETSLTFANTMKNPIEETTDWKLYQIILDVPGEAKNIDFGAMLMQEGTLWVDDYKLEVVDNSIPSDDMSTAEMKTKKLPVRNYLPNPKAINLGFEEL